VPLRSLAVAAALLLARAGAAVEPGDRIEDLQLPALAGGRASLLAGGSVNVLVFARAGHPHCLETLRDLATREGQLRGARWVAILPGSTSPEEARALAASSGVRMPFLFDPDDELYGRLRLKLHPTILVVDREGRLAALEPFREINYGDRLAARVRFTLGEIGEAELRAAEDPARSDTRSDEGVAGRHARFAQRLAELGQLDQALAEVQRGLAAAPTSLGYLVQGRVLARQGKCKEAARAFEMALRLDPGNDAASSERNRCPPEKTRAP
jgi:peroxiredoxin